MVYRKGFKPPGNVTDLENIINTDVQCIPDAFRMSIETWLNTSIEGCIRDAGDNPDDWGQCFWVNSSSTSGIYWKEYSPLKSGHPPYLSYTVTFYDGIEGTYVGKVSEFIEAVVNKLFPDIGRVIVDRGWSDAPDKNMLWLHLSCSDKFITEHVTSRYPKTKDLICNRDLSHYYFD